MKPLCVCTRHGRDSDKHIYSNCHSIFSRSTATYHISAKIWLPTEHRCLYTWHEGVGQEAAVRVHWLHSKQSMCRTLPEPFTPQRVDAILSLTSAWGWQPALLQTTASQLHNLQPH
jgi:hypothetical protein